jgi:hypothetical protein
MLNRDLRCVFALTISILIVIAVLLWLILQPSTGHASHK